MEEKIFCSVCGAKLTEETATEFEGQIFCEDCFDEAVTVCDCCGRRIWRSDATENDSLTLCDSCYDYTYTHCDERGRLIHNDDAFYEDESDYPYCQSCFEKLQERAIKSYNYKPEPTFYGSGNLYMGVELEIDKGGEDSFNAQKLLDVANERDERIYCKHGRG